MSDSPTTTRPEPRNGALHLAERRVLVLGLGESGWAMVRYLVGMGANVRVVDTRENPPGLASLKDQFPDVPFRRQELQAIELDGVDLIAWSPGLSNEIGDGNALFQRAAQSGITLVGELDLFVYALQANNEARTEGQQAAAKVLGITGTNGKTTVTELAGILASAAGASVATAGNIGPAMLDAWCDACESNNYPELWILELSSFQLALSQPFEPDAGAILNVSQDHLDWHRDLDSYALAKSRIAGKRSVAVGLRGDQRTMVSGSKHQRTIGLDEPTQCNDMGIVHDGGIPWLAWAVPAELPIPGKRADPNASVIVKKLMPADALHIRGAHNHLNALAALSLCEALGLPMAAMLHALREYKGQVHRCELVAIIDDVEYYNDSKGTNVGATVAALNGLDKRCWLIAGGMGKDQDFSSLADAIKLSAAGVMLIGRDADRIGQALSGVSQPVYQCDSLADALARAQALAQSGQAIILSPACSSFDMFDNYQHRGNTFRDLVQELALERGTGLELPC